MNIQVIFFPQIHYMIILESPAEICALSAAAWSSGSINKSISIVCTGIW